MLSESINHGISSYPLCKDIDRDPASHRFRNRPDFDLVQRAGLPNNILE